MTNALRWPCGLYCIRVARLVFFVQAEWLVFAIGSCSHCVASDDMQVETFRTHYETALTQLENDYSNFRSTGVQERPGFSAIVTHVKGCDGF